MQVYTPWTPKNTLGVQGAAAVQQSGTKGFDQKIRTASSHQRQAELNFFQQGLFGDKSGCLKFLGGRFAPTQSCLRSCSQRGAGMLRFFLKHFACKKLKKIESFQFGFVKPCCVQTIEQFRKYASLKNSDLPCLWGNSVVPNTAQFFFFQIPPLQRQGVYSAQAQYCHCHTKKLSK